MENILQIVEKNRCSGCGICAGICPSKAIKMVIEENIGFYRPLVDENKCTYCGKCLQICPFADNNYKEINSKEELFGNVIKVYSGWAKDENTRYKSASGGIATALSLEMMDKEGYFIGGTAYQKDNPIRTESFIAKNKEDVHRFISSKYIHSEYSKVVREIIKNKGNKYVIIGLPCQIAALRNIFGYNNENIILIDIFCGRMVSTKLTEKYVQHLSIGNLKYINFRDKKTTWYKHSITCRSENNEVSESFGDSLFGKFLNNYLFTQDSCLLCYNPAGRESDITLGNFWNKEKFGNERNGVSLIITRTDKGEELIKNMKSIRIKEENKEELFITQPHFLLALDKKKREKLVIKNRKLLEETDKYDLVYLNKKYNEKTFLKKVKSRIKNSLSLLKNHTKLNNYIGPKNIHIGGPMYGAHNIGDEAILTSMINSFSGKDNLSISTYNSSYIKKRFPFVLTKKLNRCFTKPFFSLYISPRKNPIKAFINLKREKEFYSKKDLYICGGATILSDCPWYSLRTIDVALKAGARTILFGVGMAEIKDKSAIPFIQKICNKLEDIYVRDNFVKRRLENIGIEANKIKICYDPALILSPSENFKVEKYLNNKQIEKYYNHYVNIGITLSGERDVINRTPINDIKKIIKFMIKKYNANIFLVPTNTRKGMDIDLMKNLLSNDNITLIEEEFSPEDLIAFMKNFSFVISSRLHMNILGSIVGTPSIGLVRNSKIIDFANLLGLKYFSIENLNIQDLERYCDELIDKNDNLRKKILQRVNKMRDIHLKTVIKIKRKYNFQ